jgi:hypothetical protein
LEQRKGLRLEHQELLGSCSKKERSKIKAAGNTRIRATGSSKIRAAGNTSIRAPGSIKIKATGSITVVFRRRKYEDYNNRKY